MYLLDGNSKNFDLVMVLCALLSTYVSVESVYFHIIWIVVRSVILKRTARIGRYVPVRQVTGMRTARYRYSATALHCSTATV